VPVGAAMLLGRKTSRCAASCSGKRHGSNRQSTLKQSDTPWIPAVTRVDCTQLSVRGAVFRSQDRLSCNGLCGNGLGTGTLSRARAGLLVGDGDI
jgi:hypothetical protein